MKKYLAITWAAFAAFFAFCSSSFAAVYTMDATTKTSIGWAAKDTADSLVWSIGDLLPILVPVIVVGFIIWVVMSKIWSR